MAHHSGKVPWHQRCAPVRWLRGALRKAFYAILKQAFQTEDGRDILAGSVENRAPRPPGLSVAGPSNASLPYADLAGLPEPVRSQQGDCPIFITARFRSGSTLLWNLFRNVPGCTSYYEPFNERRWFDPSTRGNRLDATHRNVTDYWKEYDGLSSLGDYFQEEWNCRNLFMDATAWEPDMKKYVDLLIKGAPARPVLQFNRIDFRLPWFRQQFPAAHIIHLYRHPRDQWCSALMDTKNFPKEGRLSDFPPHDKFYLLAWASDLKYRFAFLDQKRVTHPYQLFYYIWKLSYLFGKKYAHYSLSFEDLVNQPDIELQSLFHILNMDVDSVEPLKALIARPAVGQWREYADARWFQAQEAVCESVLAEWFAGFHDQPGQRGETLPLAGREDEASRFQKNGSKGANGGIWNGKAGRPSA
jgi:hypothetical protein